MLWLKISMVVVTVVDYPDPITLIPSSADQNDVSILGFRSGKNLFLARVRGENPMVLAKIIPQIITVDKSAHLKKPIP